MRKIWRITKEIISDAIYGFLYFIENNLTNFATLLYMLLPYAMLFIGEYLYDDRKKYAVGGEVLLPLVILFVIWLLNSFADRLGKGTDVPIPNKRFTDVDDDGEVNVDVERLQELLLYTADLEDWLERKGLL